MNTVYSDNVIFRNLTNFMADYIVYPTIANFCQSITAISNFATFFSITLINSVFPSEYLLFEYFRNFLLYSPFFHE